MELTLLALVVALFVAVLVLKAVLGLAVRYGLFVAVAVLVFADRRGPDVAGWMGPEEALQIAAVAAAAMIGTKVLATLFFRRSRLRVVLVPATGVALTALGAHVMAG